jgi:hypothetical protein
MVKIFLKCLNDDILNDIIFLKKNIEIITY